VQPLLLVVPGLWSRWRLRPRSEGGCSRCGSIGHGIGAAVAEAAHEGEHKKEGTDGDDDACDDPAGGNVVVSGLR